MEFEQRRHLLREDFGPAGFRVPPSCEIGGFTSILSQAPGISSISAHTPDPLHYLEETRLTRVLRVLPWDSPACLVVKSTLNLERTQVRTSVLPAKPGAASRSLGCVNSKVCGTAEFQARWERPRDRYVWENTPEEFIKYS